MRRIRILRIITRLNIGGPAAHLMAVSRGLDPARYDQWLAAGREGPGEGSMTPVFEAKGIRPILIPAMSGTPRLGPSDALAFAQIRRLVRDLAPDIVETHLTKAGIVGRLAASLDGSPLVIHVYHGHVLDGYYGPLKTWLARSAERRLARVSNGLVAVSDRVRRALVEYRVAPEDRISLLEPGLDIQEFADCRRQRGALRQELGLPSHAPIVGIVARLARIKNHALFLEAATRVIRQIPDARFLIVGDGERRPAIEAQVIRLKLDDRVVFTGWRHDMPRVYADLDVMTLCSDNEGTPVALVEAMAAGCPIVATNVGGVPDVIDDEVTGLLVPPGDATPLAAAIVRLLNDPRLAGDLAASARKRSRDRFSAQRLVADTDRLYSRLLGDRGRSDS